MDVRLDPSLAAFRDEVRTWLEEHLVGEFGRYRGRGLTGLEDMPPEVQIAWERELATGGTVVVAGSCYLVGDVRDMLRPESILDPGRAV